MREAYCWTCLWCKEPALPPALAPAGMCGAVPLSRAWRGWSRLGSAGREVLLHGHGCPLVWGLLRHSESRITALPYPCFRILVLGESSSVLPSKLSLCG